MKILGIGNAIVDVICKVDEKFIIQNKLTKSTMKLVDEIEFKKLLSTLKIEETVSGGSVANSIVGLSQLGNTVGFINETCVIKYNIYTFKWIKKGKYKFPHIQINNKLIPINNLHIHSKNLKKFLL